MENLKELGLKMFQNGRFVQLDHGKGCYVETHDKNGKVFSKFGDVLVIFKERGLCGSVTFAVENYHTHERFLSTFDNNIGVWEFVKNFGEVEGREAFYQVEGKAPVKYTDSAPYLDRFSA